MVVPLYVLSYTDSCFFFSVFEEHLWVMGKNDTDFLYGVCFRYLFVFYVALLRIRDKLDAACGCSIIKISILVDTARIMSHYYSFFWIVPNVHSSSFPFSWIVGNIPTLALKLFSYFCLFW